MVKIPNPNNVRLKKTILKNMSSTVYVHHIPETEKAVLQYTWFFYSITLQVTWQISHV